MEQLTIVLNNMKDVMREIDNCQRKAMTSVVELGYILRKADDSELYKEMGYSSIFKFAETEYGWSQSQTSRFMDINREFSQNGYSTVLQDRYQGYGQAKLSEILTLPEIVREELNPEMKREEIREIKREYREAVEENKKEVFRAAVTMEETENDILYGSVRELFESSIMAKSLDKLFRYMIAAQKGAAIDDELVRTAITGSGFGTARAGAVMYFWKKDGFHVMKGMSKKFYTYKDLLDAVNALKSPLNCTVNEWYQGVYGKDLPGMEKKEKAEDKKKTVAPAHKMVKNNENTLSSEDSNEEEKLPGQAEIGEFAEVEKIEYEKEDKKVHEVEVAPAHEMVENGENTLSSDDSGDVEVVETEQEAAGQEDVEEHPGTCRYCDGTCSIKSNDESFIIKLQRSGVARIEHETGLAAIVELDYCPKCGKELCISAD